MERWGTQLLSKRVRHLEKSCTNQATESRCELSATAVINMEDVGGWGDEGGHLPVWREEERGGGGTALQFVPI